MISTVCLYGTISVVQPGDVLTARALTIAQENVDGRNVKEVRYSPGEGIFQQQSNGSWIEKDSSGQLSEFRELARDQWSVYLLGKSNRLIQLDLYEKTIREAYLQRGLDLNANIVRLDQRGSRIYTITRSFDVATGPVNKPQGPTSPVATQPQSGSIDRYITSLQYSPERLLAVRGDGSTTLKETQKPLTPTRSEGVNAVITCNSVLKDAERNFGEVAIFQPTRDIIWPGSLIKADLDLVDGRPSPITSLQRSPVKLNIDLPGIGPEGNRVVQNPNYGSFRAEIDRALEWWNNNAYQEGYVNASRSTYLSSTAYSSEQLAMSLGFNAKWLPVSLSSQFSRVSDREKYVSVVIYKQVFYTVTFELPSTPATVFDNSVTLSQVRTVVNSESPPAYIASVDYGRFVMFRMETDRKFNEIDAKAALEFAIGAARGGSVKTNYQTILDDVNTSITVTTLGGNAKAASEVVSARGAGDLESYLQGENAVYSKSNPGEPIAYKVNFLKDNRLAKMGTTTQYTEERCKEQKNGHITLFHQGGYVAKFEVSWDVAGKSETWRSGDQTAGWKKTLHFPGDATNFSIKATAYTGLVWSPENEIINVNEPGIPNKCYKVFGTTLNTAYDNNCK